MSAAPALLSLEEIHTYYGNSHILQGVSLEVRAGEVVALLGRNGVGKTTTVQSILGLPAPRRGRVLLRDRDVAGQSPHAIVRAGVGWVPQGHRIFPTLSVDENLRLAARNRRPGRWDVDGVYGLFPRLRERSTARGGSLSGGEQQMLAIGRTLVQNPDVILMDEPSEGLSPRIVDEVGRIIAMLATAGAAVLVVEQNLSFALRVATEVLVMTKGRIVFKGPARQLAEDPDACSRYLGVTGTVGAGRAREE